MAMFHSYFDITRGYALKVAEITSHLNPLANQGFKAMCGCALVRLVWLRNELFLLPSGYVEIAMENAQQNSGFTLYHGNFP